MVMIQALCLHIKKDTPKNMEIIQYRGIILLSVVAKVYERMLDTRLREKRETQLHEPQSRFRRRRSTQDHILSIIQMSGKTGREKIICLACFD